jgi:MerR, DNA binding
LLQDAGLALDEIDAIFRAATVADWKAIARRRLAVIDEELAQLKYSRDLLAAALGCRFDHPATDCRKMGAEIDRRLRTRTKPEPRCRRRLRRPRQIGGSGRQVLA